MFIVIKHVRLITDNWKGVIIVVVVVLLPIVIVLGALLQVGPSWSHAFAITSGLAKTSTTITGLKAAT